MDATSVPDMMFSNRFKETWTKFQNMVDITVRNEVPDDFRFTILGFLEYIILRRKNSLDDYQELLELTIIFHGGIPKT